MSHKPMPYSPNFPASQGYAPPPDDKQFEDHELSPRTSNPHPPTVPMYSPRPTVPTDPSIPQVAPVYVPPQGVPTGFQPGFQPGYQFQPAFAPGYPHPQPVHLQPQPAYVQPQPGHPQAVTQQPGLQGPQDTWMSIPQGISNCPPGLEYLSAINQLVIHQKQEILEILFGFETKNKYSIKNSLLQKVYYAAEDSNFCTRLCCGAARPFDMVILDNFQKEVIHLKRPLACEDCCCPCCLQSMTVYAPAGILIGSIEQRWSIFKPSYDIKNAAGDVVLKIRGPIFTCGFLRNVNFTIYSNDGVREIGKISKNWSGFVREAYTDADNFTIYFPMDLDVKIKAVLLGACFLIDFMFFESRKR